MSEVCGMEIVTTKDRSAAAELMAIVWREMLEIESVRDDDNFFDLGGHSLRATRLAAQLQDIFDCEIVLSTVFERPTIHELVGELRHACGGGEAVEERARTWLRHRREVRKEVV
jgi:acyl carrier protein